MGKKVMILVSNFVSKLELSFVFVVSIQSQTCAGDQIEDFKGIGEEEVTYI